MLRKLSLVVCLGFLISCSTMMDSATTRMATNLSSAILNQNDPETVRDGAPAYLLLIDSLIEENPEDPTKLSTGAKLYGAYASIFVKDEKRAKLMASKSLAYAKRALCLRNETLCRAYDQPYEVFQSSIAQTSVKDVPTLFMFGSAWATWMKANSNDWNSIANLPKIKSMLQRIVELQEDYEQGSSHVYLGVLASQLPPSLGGKPEQARTHFERAIQLSKERNLMFKVLFASHYARLVYNRELHDRLLKEVLAADPEIPGLTLMNTLARQEARVLLDSGDDYF